MARELSALTLFVRFVVAVIVGYPLTLVVIALYRAEPSVGASVIFLGWWIIVFWILTKLKITVET